MKNNKKREKYIFHENANFTKNIHKCKLRERLRYENTLPHIGGWTLEKSINIYIQINI